MVQCPIAAMIERYFGADTLLDSSQLFEKQVKNILAWQVHCSLRPGQRSLSALRVNPD